MPYYTDTVASFTLLKSVIETYCVANGWTLFDDILSKDSCFFKLTSTSLNLILEGGTSQTSSALNGRPPSPIGGGLGSVKIQSVLNDPILFPITFHIHIFNNPNEVYVFIEYNTGCYQHLGFGKSNLSGIGLGSWFTGSCNGAASTVLNSSYFGVSSGSSIIFYSENNAQSTINVGFFVGGGYDSLTAFPTSFLYTSLDSSGWYSSFPIKASNTLAGLLTALPNLSNQATILLPIKSVIGRSSGGLSIINNLNNSRLLRMDNHQSGDIVSFGSEQWKVYPWRKRDLTQRNGGSGIFSGLLHSGTFGFAIRYEV